MGVRVSIVVHDTRYNRDDVAGRVSSAAVEVFKKEGTVPTAMVSVGNTDSSGVYTDTFGGGDYWVFVKKGGYWDNKDVTFLVCWWDSEPRVYYVGLHWIGIPSEQEEEKEDTEDKAGGTTTFTFPNIVLPTVQLGGGDDWLKDAWWAIIAMIVLILVVAIVVIYILRRVGE